MQSLELVGAHLESLFEENLKCTSRAPHKCTVQAHYAVSSRVPCPDPRNDVLWCQGRRDLYERIADEVNCVFCKRLVRVCWIIRPF